MLFSGTFPTEKNGVITATAWVNSPNGMTVKQWKIKKVTVGMIACAATVVIAIVLNEGPSVDLISLRAYFFYYLIPNGVVGSSK